MNQLRLLVLGAPELWRGDERIILPTRKALALLVYLALEGGLHPRDRLLALFWPESDEKHGRGALRTTLTYLRQALQTAVGSLNDIPLYTTVDQIGLSADPPLVVDAHLLADALHSTDLTELTAVLALSRGSFLEGFSVSDATAFEAWATVQREQIQRQLSQLFGRLVASQMAARQLEAAVTTAVQWITVDPFHEAAHRRLIEAHLLTGNRTAALQAYEQCKTLLATELGIAPDAATQALGKRLHEGTKLAKGALGQEVKGKGEVGVPFVGRSAEHGQLVACWELAQSGQTQVVILQGEPGIGKTRLAGEFLRWAALQGSDVVQGRAFEAGGRLPYQPLLDALRLRLERENAPEDLLSDVWLAELSRLLPELRDRYPDLEPPTADERLAAVRLLEAIARLGQGLAGVAGWRGAKTAVWFIDDLQWADAASLDALFYCARTWAVGAAPVLLLLALRSEALALDTHLANWLAHLMRDVPLTHLPLGPLTTQETSDLLATWRQNQPSLAVLGDWLYRETAGHPFYISETLKAWQEQARSSWVATSTQLVAIPGVRQLILSRVNQLSLTARGLLTAVAVLGRPASFSHLCQVAGFTDEAALPGLDELLARNLLAETANRRHPYTFTHDKVRDVVYTEASEARRRIFHHRAYVALLPEQTPAAELAHHALAAGLLEQALSQSLAAGEAAMAIFALRDATYHYEQGRKLLSEVTAVAPGQQQTLYAQLGRAYELLGDLPQAEAVCQEMLALARRSKQPEMVCAALNRLASLAIFRQQIETAVVYLREAAQMAESHHLARWLVEAEWNLAQLTQHQYDMQASLHHSQRALAGARELNDPELIAGSLNSLGYAQLLLGNFAACVATMQEARARYAALGNRALEADSLTGVGGGLVFQARNAEAIVILQEAQGIYRQIENPWGMLFSGGWLAAGLVANGRLTEALDGCLAATEQVRTLGTTPVSIWNRLWLGNTYRALQANEAALAAHEAAARLNEATPLAAFAWYIAAELCADHVLAGRWATAYGYACEVLRRCVYRAVPQIVLPQWTVTAVLLHAGDTQQAHDDLRQSGEHWGTLPLFRIPYLRAMAVAAEWAGQVSQAIGHLEEALAWAQRLSLPVEEWSILASLAGLYAGHAQAAQALAVVESLAGQVADVALREQFVNRAKRHLAQPSLFRPR